MIDGAPEGAAQERAPGDDGARWQRAAEYFRAWEGGDGRAMDDLVRLMTPVLWQVTRAYGIERTLSEDVVQTTWMRLVRNHASLSDPRAVSAWLITTARREAWRVGKLHRRTDATDIDDLEPLLPAQRSAEDHATISDEARRLWAAVQQLAERCRRLLRVIAYDDRPDYSRLAEELSMPVGSIGPTRQRCLAKLRALLEDPTTQAKGAI